MATMDEGRPRVVEKASPIPNRSVTMRWIGSVGRATVGHLWEATKAIGSCKEQSCFRFEYLTQMQSHL